jgi:hypothetical protein
MRCGQYTTQSSGKSKYKAFVPNPLPFKVKMDNVLQSLLSEADQALGRLDGIAELLPDVDFFVLMYIGKEATLSSQVEGTQATLSDLLKAEAKIEDIDVRSDVDEIQNYVRAMNYGLDRIETLPMSLRLIREIHKELLRGVRGRGKTPGVFRKSQNWVGGHSIETASFVPPPAHEMMPLLSNPRPHSYQDGSGPPAIRGDPSFPRRERQDRPPPRHLLSLPAEGPEKANAIPVRVLQSEQAGILRQVERRP